jgi:hypothetical protein
LSECQETRDDQGGQPRRSLHGCSRPRSTRLRPIFCHSREMNNRAKYVALGRSAASAPPLLSPIAVDYRRQTLRRLALLEMRRGSGLVSTLLTIVEVAPKSCDSLSHVTT